MTARVYRTDGPMGAGASLRSPRRDANGFLRVEGALARTGVYDYPQANGTVRRELVRPEELFSAGAMAALPGLPVTDRHPAEMVTPENARRYQAGSIGSAVRADGIFLVADYTITDAALIEKIERGDQVELSPGYWCQLDETPGVWEGQPYDAVQMERTYNHAAIVPEGRCSGVIQGVTCACAIRTDGATMAKKKSYKVKRTDGTTVEMSLDMLKEAIAGMEPAAAIEYLLALLGQGEDEPAAEPAADAGGVVAATAPKPEDYPGEPNAPRTDAKLAGIVARLAALETENKKLQVEVVARREDAARATADVPRLVEARLDLETGCRALMGEAFDAAICKTQRTAHLAALKHVYAGEAARFDGMTDVELEVRWRVARERHAAGNFADTARIDEAPRGQVSKSTEARQRMIERNRSMGQGKLSSGVSKDN